jgi:hypothetical protein
MTEKYSESEQQSIRVWNEFLAAEKVTKAEIVPFGLMTDNNKIFLSKFIVKQIPASLDENDRVHYIRHYQAILFLKMSTILLTQIANNSEMLADIQSGILTHGVITESEKTVYDILLETIDKDDADLLKNYYRLAQSQSSNNLAKNITAKKMQTDRLSTGRIDTKDFKLSIRGFKDLNGINTSAAKLLDCLVITASASGLHDTTVRLPLREYMEMRGLKDERKARAQIKRDIDALDRISFEYIGQGKSRGDWFKVKISGGVSGVVNGIITYYFSSVFFESLKYNESKYYFMYMPKEAFQLNDNANPYSYFFARRIALHKRMNAGEDNADKISISTIIDGCATFPTHEDVKSLDGNVSSRIIKPFERDMNALEGAFKWEYVRNRPTTYQEFVDTTVSVIWSDYPDISKLEEGKMERKQRIAKQKSKPKTKK